MVTTKHFTVSDLWKLNSSANDYELIEGELIEVSPVKLTHGIVQLRIGSRLLAYVEQHRLGVVGTEVGFVFQRKPDSVLAPDVSFIRTERITPEGPFWSQVPPDLAVEVVSPSNTRDELDRKLRIYLESGVRLVWFVRPDARTITVHQPGSPPRTLTANDTLSGDDILPGFSVPVADVFA